MRNRFVIELEERARENEKLILLVGDIGFGVFENFKSQFPDRYINMGIAEQNMISVASGLAKEGYSPVVYTIIPFLTMRAFEQIRVDIGMHGRNVILVGVGGGFSYDILGPTHHALEDVALMRSVPGMNIFTPGSPDQLSKCASEIFQAIGPTYVRLGKNGEKNLKEGSDFDTNLGAFTYGPDSSVIFVSHGPLSFEVETARQAITLKTGLPVRHISVVRNEPVSISLFEHLKKYGEEVYFFEENYYPGSLYSEYCRYYSQVKTSNITVSGVVVEKKFYSRVASRAEILNEIGLSSEKIEVFFYARTATNLSR
jgi:transketolase